MQYLTLNALKSSKNKKMQNLYNKINNEELNIDEPINNLPNTYEQILISLQYYQADQIMLMKYQDIPNFFKNLYLIFDQLINNKTEFKNYLYDENKLEKDLENNTKNMDITQYILTTDNLK